MGHMDRNVDQKYQKYATAKENTRKKQHMYTIMMSKNNTVVHESDGGSKRRRFLKRPPTTLSLSRCLFKVARTSSG